jgi:hypothetical protein
MCVAAVVPLLAVGCYSGLELERDAGKAGGQPETGSETEPEGGGDTDSGGPDAQPPALCNGEPGVSPRPMLRLTPLEYENTMRDLLGDPGFTAEYDELEPVITERAVRQIRNGAEEAMARRDQWTTSVYACDLAGPEDPGCVDAFLDDFVPKAFRRPLRETERPRSHWRSVSRAATGARSGRPSASGCAGSTTRPVRRWTSRLR